MIFAARGKPSRYQPIAGPEILCKAIRQGGGQPVPVGPVRITLERVSFHVRRADVPAPAAGATLLWSGETFTVDAVQPVANDAEGLLWSLEASWGAAITYRSVTGAGADQAPPLGTGFTIAANTSAGAITLGITSSFTVGRLLPGDRLQVTGDATQYTVGSPAPAAIGNTFAAVPITPALAANAAAGASIIFAFQRDYALRAAVAGYTAFETMGGVQIGDRRLVLMQAEMSARGMAADPKAGDIVTISGKAFKVQSATPLYQGAMPQAWDIQVRG